MPAVRGDGMRGLAVFISDIRFLSYFIFPCVSQMINCSQISFYENQLSLRNCKNKEAEVKRINKELANIRSKFKVS